MRRLRKWGIVLIGALWAVACQSRNSNPPKQEEDILFIHPDTSQKTISS